MWQTTLLFVCELLEGYTQEGPGASWGQSGTAERAQAAEAGQVEGRKDFPFLISHFSVFSFQI